MPWAREPLPRHTESSCRRATPISSPAPIQQQESPQTSNAESFCARPLRPRSQRGRRVGYTPQIGTFVSELTWMRDGNGILAATKGLTQADLDYLVDPNSNTIGALMLHVAATEVYYGLNTFDGMKWGSWPDSVKKQWDPAMNLGKVGRDTIKGHDRDYYVNILADVRAKTLASFKKKDDAWFLGGVEDWFGPTNTFCKWFHVCEHESNHNGQLKFLKKRIPGAKPDSE